MLYKLYVIVKFSKQFGLLLLTGMAKQMEREGRGGRGRQFKGIGQS